MACYCKPPKKDFYLRKENDFFEHFSADQCVIIKQNYLQYTAGIKYEIKEEYSSPAPVEWYPHANSYYPYAEDVDPVERVNHLLGDKPSYVSLNSFYADSEVKELVYSSKNAQQNYLESNPVSFIILGKPGVGEENLGKQLADYWQCVYIEPSLLIEQEIRSESRAGQCIEFNLRCGRAVGIDVILRLVEKRVNSESAKHRGFVICGLPVIPNSMYKEDPTSSESAVFTVKDIFEEILDTTFELGVPPPSKPQLTESLKAASKIMRGEGGEEVEEERVLDEQAGEGSIPILPFTPVDLPTEPPVDVDVGQDYGVCQPPEISINYEEQLNFLFNLLKPPFLIIYLISNTKDLITKRKNEKYDIYSKLHLNLLHETANKAIFNYFAKRNDRVNELPVDSYETFIHDIETELAHLKHLVTLPKNFPINVESQLDSYHYTAMNFIERRIMTHDPQYFVKLDGRTSIRRMFHVLKAKLNSLPLQKVVIPEKIALEASPTTGEASPVEGFVEALSLEESFHQYRKLRTPSTTFRWNWSDWGIKCPVALRNGVLKDGDNKYTVHFMDKIFFLSDENAFLKFHRNPRPYLLEPYPKPTCKIFIFGPKCSGKTAVANCLAYLLNGTVLSTVSIVDDYIEQRENEFREKIRQAALAEGLALLNQLRQKEAEDAEEERINRIKEWIATVKSMVETYAQLMEDLENEAEKAKLELSSFPMAMVKYSIAEIETETTIAIKKLKDQFIHMNIPEGPLEVLEHFVQDKQKMMNAIPDNLKKKITPKPATVYDEFVIQHVNNALATAVFVQENVSSQNIVEMMVAAIKDIEERYLEQGNNRGGWIIDGMLSDVDIFKNLYPDYIADDIFILKDTDDFEFLRRRFKTRGANIFTNFRDFFMSIGKVDAAWRAPSKVISTTSFKNKIGRSILSEIFDDAQLGGTTSAGNLIRDETYFEDLLRYKMKIMEAEDYFKEINKDFLELEVTDKTLPELLLEAIRLIQDQYRVKATQFTDADRAEEIAMFSQQEIAEEAVGEGTIVVKDAGEDLIEINRRYGDTYHYCPVTFHEKWVLWKGRSEYAVKFNDQVYFLCSEEVMKKFLQSPRNFLTGKPPKMLPPPRICVIGIPGTGKTHLAKAISFNYGIFYVSFESLVKSYYHIDSNETFEELKKNPNINQHLRQYINGEAPLPEKFYLKHIHQLWFEYPIKELGFVIDDFPKRLSDVQMMIKLKMIPDIVIQLSADELDIKNKLLEVRLADWQANMLIKRALWEQANKESLQEYERKRENKFKEMLEEKREERYSTKKKLKVENLDEDNIGNISQVSFDSIAEQNDMDEINRMLDANLPVLISEPPEQFDEIRQLYDTQISEHVNEEAHFLKEVQTACDGDLIPYSSIPMHLEDYDKNERAVYYYTEHIKFRNQSFFERCYEVSTEVAERLLSYGYYFLSKFGKLCPVQYNENRNPFFQFQFMELKNNVFPVIHRSYIYYIIGKENVEKFKKHPLKYLEVDSVNFPNLPMKLAVTGPPKCGKTVLAKRIQAEYGMKIISRGQAIRFVLTILPFSSLAANLETVLRKGWEATDEMVVRCVEAATIDPWGVTQGVIFDGFPNSISEVRHMSYVGLIPQLVIDLQSTKRQSFECLENDEVRMGFPKYSLRFVNHLYKEYRECAETFKPWFDREYQVTNKIFINTCNWSVWYQANKVITAVFFEIKHYFIHCHQDWPLRLGNMQVTPLEFLERQSSYKTFCPCCLHFSNMLTSGGDVPDRTGLVQWRQFYYWLCPEHIELFLKTPEAFLPPYGANALPPYLPTRLHLKLFPINLFEDGTCIVCYKNKTVIIKGVLKYAVGYNHKTYLFDCLECLEEFMKRPSQYSFNIRFRPPENYPTLEYSELPILGMLEQYVAKDLITAVKFISRRRPVIPGLSVSTSAAVGIGLYLKVFDNSIPGEYKARYLQGDELFHSRREKLVEYLHKMKHIINPYLHYEEPLPKFQMVWDSTGPSSSSSIKSEIDIL